MVKKMHEDSDSDSAPEEVGISHSKKLFQKQNQQVQAKSVKRSAARRKTQTNRAKANNAIEEDDLETILATKLDDRAFEKLQTMLDKFGESKSQKIKETLASKRDMFVKSTAKEKKRYAPLALKKDPKTRFIIDNNKTRKIISKASKSISEFKAQQFYSGRLERTSLNKLLNKN
uniref:Uncharacterized protein n=1 Tax=Euplotes harpa TaxID=151035 RepID=A0A7S3N7J3_9SPIT|mmetsp:Transcript_20191/g.23369  ORF Transcript_20191/g.23369 Transcript_20191/m.23369 type:complete len:174 (+) Transcript_20191:16-537(+)